MSLEDEARKILDRNRLQQTAEVSARSAAKTPAAVPWVIELAYMISSSGFAALPLYQRHNSQHDEIGLVSPLGGWGWLLHAEWPRSAAYDNPGQDHVAITPDGRIYNMWGFDRGVRDTRQRWGTTLGYKGVEESHRNVILCGDPEPLANSAGSEPTEACRVAFGVLGAAALLSGVVQEKGPGHLYWYMHPTGVLNV